MFTPQECSDIRDSAYCVRSAGPGPVRFGSRHTSSDEWARRSRPTRIDTPLACYLIVSFRWLSSGACLTMVIL